MQARKKLIVGLGNPGPEFEGTYHSVGAAAVRALAGGLPFKAHKRLFAFAATEDAAFVIPLVFMNVSGRAVKEAMKKFSARPGDLVVIHDDSDLPVGKWKTSTGRGAAGHKGVQSIMDAVGTNDFTRIRIGIRNPRERKRKKAEEFVLKKISPKDRSAFRDVFASLERETTAYCDPSGGV